MALAQKSPREGVDERLYNPRLAPPGEEMRAISEKRGVRFGVKSAVDQATLRGSNSFYSKKVMRSLKNCMMISKRTTRDRRVGKFGSVFKKFKSILGSL